MVRTRNVLAMLQQNFIALGVVSLTWVLVGYTIAFGDDAGSGLFGNLELFGLADLGDARTRAARGRRPHHHPDAGVRRVPDDVRGDHAGVGHRRHRGAGCVSAAGSLFLAVWSIVVYAPIAHWLWHPGGWLAKFGTQDWAGGTVVHAQRRRRRPRRPARPRPTPGLAATRRAAALDPADHRRRRHPVVRLVRLQRRRRPQANGVAAQAVLNTHLAARRGDARLAGRGAPHATDTAPSLGAVSGAVAGLADSHARPPGTSARLRPSDRRCSPAWSATSRCSRSTCFGSTTRST